LQGVFFYGIIFESQGVRYPMTAACPFGGFRHGGDRKPPPI